ncbi:MAG: hypothetical protein ACRDKB_01015 [Actinomycetota bacterium]
MAQIGPDEVRVAARASREFLEGASDGDWAVRAGPLQWDCRTTAAHIADALAFYAGHLGARASEWLKFDVVPHADASNRHLAHLIEAMGEVLAQVIEAAPADVRAYHHSGMWDKETFAAFGCVEALVHTGDIAAGLDVPYDPPQELCRRVITRLFAEAPEDGDPWSVLWWATGRGGLPGREQLGADWMAYWLKAADRR